MNLSGKITTKFAKWLKSLLNLFPLDCVPPVAHIREKAIEAPPIHTLCTFAVHIFSIYKLRRRIGASDGRT